MNLIPFLAPSKYGEIAINDKKLSTNKTLVKLAYQRYELVLCEQTKPVKDLECVLVGDHWQMCTGPYGIGKYKIGEYLLDSSDTHNVIRYSLDPLPPEMLNHNVRRIPQHMFKEIADYYAEYGRLPEQVDDLSLGHNRPQQKPAETVLDDIVKELNRAEAIHPDYPTDIFKQLAIMQEEAGEVTKAVLDYSEGEDTLEHVKEELIQTAAMCIRMIKNL